MQFLSITNPDDAWLDFEFSTIELLTGGGLYYIDPPFLPQLFPFEFGSFTTSSRNSSSDASTKTPAASNDVAGAADLEAVQPTSTGGISHDRDVVALLDKYGPAIIGLLAASLAMMLILCIIGLFICTRGVLRTGAKTRTISPAYVPVSYKEKGPDADDPEFNAPVHSYNDQ